MVQIIIAGIVGVIIGVGIMWAMAKSGLDRNTTRSRLIIDEANSKAETIVRQADLDGQQKVYEMKMKAEKELKDQRSKVQSIENRLLRREDSLNFREQNLSNTEKKLAEKEKQGKEE